MKPTIFVIIGFNSSTYGFARSLNSNYGIKPYVFGDEEETSPILFSSIVDCHPVRNFYDKHIFCRVLIDFAKKQSHPCILLCSSELNLFHVVNSYDLLSKYFIIPYPKPLVNESYFDKHLAKRVCELAKIPYPVTVSLTIENEDTFIYDSLKFPVVLKPSVSALYKNLVFDNKSKNFFIDNEEQLQFVSKKIRQAGYTSSLLVQEIIPSEQYNEYSVNGYIDQQGHLRAVAFGRALLGWPNPTRRGNHLVIVSVTEKEQSLLLSLVHRFFSVHAYYGFFNIDFIQNSQTGEMVLIEFNPRQGRSHFYCELSGVSLVQAMVDDVVENQPSIKTELPSRSFVWLDASLKHVFDHLVTSQKERLENEITSKNIDFTWTYPYDLKESQRFKKHVTIKINNMDKLLFASSE